MKLIDFLNQRIETEPDYAERILKIGSSTGYFYCGTTENFMKKIGCYDTTINKFFCNAAATFYSQYEQQLKNPPRIVDYAKEVLQSDGARFSIEEFENRIIDWFISTRNRYSAAKNAETIAKETKPLSEREVIKKSVCGNTMLHPECSHCGFNPEENERRKQIGFTVRPDGMRCKIITKGEIADAAIT